MMPGAPNRRKRYLMARQAKRRQQRRMLEWNRRAIDEILRTQPVVSARFTRADID